MSAIVARDLFYLYRAPQGDVAALRGLDLTVGDGEVVAVLGPSGSGKSTLLSLFAGLRRPSGGDLAVLGVPAERLGSRGFASLRRDAIGVVRQHYHRALPAELTVSEIVELPLRLAGRHDSAGRAAARALLARAGLDGLGKRRPSELSGGEQQRVAVCAALAKRPRLLLADEPTGELDAAATARVVDLMLELAAEAGTATVIVTHDPVVAERTSRTIQIRDGRQAAEGMTDPVLIMDDQGWLRLPRALRATAGLGSRVRARAEWERVELRPANDREQVIARTTAALAPPPLRHGLPVHLRDVTMAYGAHRVLDRFSTDLEPGLLHALAGPSGSGKTTVLNLVTAVERPLAGDVVVGDIRVDRLDGLATARLRQTTVGYASQHSTLVDFMTAHENVALALHLRGVDAAEAAQRAADALALVGLHALADRPADRLSGGEQRRVALARALAPRPAVLVVDEPTAHLDRANGRLVLHALADLAHNAGATVLVATHDPDVIAMADAVHTPAQSVSV